MKISVTPLDATASNLPLEQWAKNGKISDEAKISELSRQFEAILLRQILQSAQKAVIKSDLLEESATSGIYKDMVNAQLADKLSQSGALGLGRVLAKDLTRQLRSQKSPEEKPIEN